MARKTLVSSSHVVIEPRVKEWSHNYALSLREKVNKCKHIASMEATSIFKVSHTSRKTDRCKFGSFMGVPPNVSVALWI